MYSKKLFIILFLLQVSLSYSMVLRIKPRNFISGDTVRIEHITELIEGDENVYRSIKQRKVAELHPEQGFINISLNDIAVVLEDKSVDLLGSNSIIRRKRHRIEEASVRRDLENFLEHKFSLSEKFQIKIYNFPKNIFANSRELNFSFSINSNLNRQNRLNILCKISENDIITNSFSFFVELSEFINVYVPVRNLARNHKISNHDIRQESRWVNILDDVLVNSNDIEGKVTERFISGNSVLYGHYLKKEFDVRRNSTINITVLHGNLKVKSEVIAKENGYIGEIISVENLYSRQLFSAEIAGVDKVILKMED